MKITVEKLQRKRIARGRDESYAGPNGFIFEGNKKPSC